MLSLDGSTLSYQFGNTNPVMLTQTLSDTSGLDTLFVRARAEQAGGSSITDLIVTTSDGTFGLDPVLSIGAGGTDAGYLALQGKLTPGFKLSGKMTFDWTETRPTGSAIIGQFKLGTSTGVVPEPSSVVMVASALLPIGLISVRKMRRRKPIEA